MTPTSQRQEPAETGKSFFRRLVAKLKSSFRAFIAKFTVLRGAVRELWIVFGAKLLTIMAYQVMNLTLPLWLSWDLGYDDVGASNIIVVWSMLMTLFTVLVGSFVDAIGLRKAFLLGLGICFLSRGMLTFATSRWLALSAGLLPLALGEALMTPVMVAAIRRYTTTRQRSISYALFFALMNAGFGLAALTFDHLRQNLGEHGHSHWLGLELSTYRTLFLVSLLLTLPMLALMYFGLREGVEATDEGVRITPEPPPSTQRRTLPAFGLMIRDTLRQTVRIFAGLWRESAFYRFLGFLFLVVGLRLIYYHMYYTYPKFGIRELGEGAPVGRLWAINALVVLILVPIIGALTQKISAYRMIVCGSFISASSIFLMALPPQWFQSLADGWLGDWVGHGWLGLKGTINPYYVMIFLYVLWLSIGEALWNPRLYEYTASIAPKGQEASYLSLSYLPYFAAKIVVGLSSGHWLARYCPQTGPRHSEMLWLLIALPTLVTPFGLLLLKRYIRVREAGRDEG
jgi:MFS family permease